MTRQMLAFVAFILFISFLVNAQDNNVFYNPPTGGPIHEYEDDPAYKLGQTLQVRWTTTLPRSSLVLWQNGNSNYEWIQTNISATSFDWIVSTNNNLSAGNIFFLQIRDPEDPIDGLQFGSHYFNITEDPSASTTASAASTKTPSPTSSVSLITSSQTLQTSSASQTGATTTNSPSNTGVTGSNSRSGGLSQEAELGVGLGVGLGVSFILTLAGFLFLYFRRQSANRRDTGNQIPHPVNYPYTLDYKMHRQPQIPAFIEAPDSEAPRNRAYELQS